MIKQVVIPEPLKDKLKDKEGFPPSIRKNFHWFYWCLDMLLKDENHPLLKKRKIEGAGNYWEFTITLNCKGIYRKEKDTAILLAVIW